jgi:hypothetical protein
MIEYINNEFFATHHRMSRINTFDTPNGVPRTSNAAEGYHHKLNATFSTAHPSLSRLLYEIVTSEHLAEIRRRKLAAGCPPRRRKVVYVHLDQRISDAKERLLADIANIQAHGGIAQQLQERLEQHARFCSRLLGGALHEELVGDEVDNDDA